jgi:trehalose 6-phosphate phosphatase
VRRWVPVLARHLGGFKGVVIENKVFSLAIHYRLSRQRQAARSAIEAALSSLDRVRVVGGKRVYNVLPEDAPHKGVALLAARARAACDAAVYIGDDDTDEDVFGLDDPGRLLSVRVGASTTSRASYFISNQRDIDSFLTILLDCGRNRQPVDGQKPNAA